MDKTVFSKQMLGLAVIFNEPCGGSRWTLKLDIYWRVFEGWPDERFETAVNRYVHTGRFFPKPAELHEADTPAALSGEEAWGELMTRLANGIPSAWGPPVRLPRAIAETVRAMGGLHVIAESDTPLSILRTQFVQTYHALKARQEEDHYLGHAPEAAKALGQQFTMPVSVPNPRAGADRRALPATVTTVLGLRE